MYRRIAILFASFMFAFAPAHSFAGADVAWGDFSGQFIYGGEVSAPAALPVAAGFCVAAAPVDESLVVDAKTKGLANVVVFMYLKKNDNAPDVHPDYAKTANVKASLDNKGCAFSPRILAMRTTQVLALGNKDPEGHNVKGNCVANPEFNPVIPANGNLDINLPNSERLPFPVSCNIHPFMKGYVLVKDNPYFAVTDKDGKFTIKNVPKGNWVFQFWHEKIGYVKEVEIDGAKVAWKKGRLPVQIAAAGKDLGVVTVPAFKE